MRSMTLSVSVPVPSLGRQDAAEGLWILAIFLLVNLVSASFQRPVAGNGLIWDAVNYHQMAAQIAGGDRIATQGPYVYRPGTAFLAAMVARHDLLLGFRIVNILANLLTAILLAVWLGFFLRSRVLRVALVTMFVTTFAGPVRWGFYYPIFADNWAYVFVLSSLILMRLAAVRTTPRLLCLASLLVFVGVMFREFVLTIGFAWLFLNNPIRYQKGSYSLAFPTLWLLSPLLAGIAGLLVVKLMVSQVGPYSFLQAATNSAQTLSIVRYLHGWFNAYGPVLAFAVFGIRGGLRLFSRHQYLLVFFLAIALLMDVGGSNIEKFAQWAMPVVYLLIGRTVEDHAVALAAPPFVACVAVLQGLSQRLIWVLPDHSVQGAVSSVLLTPLGDPAPYLSLWAFFAEPGVSTTAFLQYVGTTVLLVAWMASRTGKLKVLRAS